MKRSTFTHVSRDKNPTHVSVKRTFQLPRLIGEAIPRGKLAYNTVTNVPAYSDGTQWRDLNLNESIAIYDAIVSPDGEEGTYPLLSAAIAAGNKFIFVKEGTYVETTQITFPAGTVIDGEKTRTTIIIAAGLATPFIVNTIPAGTIETTGTISATNGSAAVTGVGTTFTNLAPGSKILVGAIYYTVLSITNDTLLTLTATYEGESFTGNTYIAAMFIEEVRINDLTFLNSPTNPSTGVGINLIQVQGVRFRGVIVSGFAGNMVFDVCAAVLLNQCVSLSSTAIGIVFDDVVNSQLTDSASANSVGSGVNITGSLFMSLGITMDSCFLSNNGDHGIFIDDGSRIINFTNSVIQFNVTTGIRCTNGTSRILIDQCNIKMCGVGINHSGSYNTISSCIITDCTSTGIITGDNAMVVGNTVSNNGGVGIDMQSDQDNTITGNIVQDNGSDGISISGNTQASTITGNAIFNNTGNGINLGGNAAGDNTLSSNTIRNNGQNGIRIRSDDNVVIGNRSDSNTGDGVLVENTANATIVAANNLTGNGGASLTDNGTGTVTSGANIV